MKNARPAMRERAPARLGVEDCAPTSLHWNGAFAVCVALSVITLIAVLLGRSQGPEVRPLIPLAAGIWALADLLTAFLLLAQFFVNGRRFFGLLAVAYAFTGLLTCPYVAAFPEVFRHALTPGDQQVSIYLWSIWHALFPLLIICATIDDSALGRIVSRRAIQRVTGAFVVATLVASAAIAMVVFAQRESLPVLILHGHFQPAFRTIFLPSVIGLDVAACFVLLRPSRLTPLKICLALAVFSAALDAWLNLTSNAYSYAWDTSKLVTVFTGSVVLVMMLCDIAGLYGRLARIANVDVVTSLQNRRAFEEHMTVTFHSARRLRNRFSLLLIDIDHFKRYNDSFGHSGGDECLRLVARAIADCVTRPLDLVARFGGEEFVVVLPNTPLQGALVLAERIRTVVQQLEMAHDARPLGPVTVSIGVAYAADAGTIGSAALFEAADRGLYEAKAGGRNRVVLGTADPMHSPAPQMPRDGASGPITGVTVSSAHDA